jgi:hypothetical protein
MNDADRVEIIKLNTWKNNNYVQIFGLYNTPQNNPALSLLHVSMSNHCFGHFNAHFHAAGLKHPNGTGKTTEDFILTNNIELLYKKEDIPTYLHYKRPTTNSDLTLAFLNIAELATRKITDNPG